MEAIKHLEINSLAHAARLLTAALSERISIENPTAAFNNLGVISLREGNLIQAKDWFNQAAERGDCVALENLAQIELEEGNFNQELWLAAAKAGSSRAMVELGLLALETDDVKEARNWFGNAVKENDYEALAELGRLNWKQGDLLLAKQQLSVSAAEGRNVKGMFYRAEFALEQGDFEGAKQYFRMAANYGDSDAQYNLGVLLEEEGNELEANKWFELSENQTED